MSALLEERDDTRMPDPLDTDELATLAGDLGVEAVPEADDRVVTPAALGFAVVSGALSSAGAAWMVSGTFRGGEARLIALLGVVVGAGLVWLGTRVRSSVMPYLVLPVALLVGAVLMGSATGAGTSSLGALVRDAVSSSQVLQPPLDFAPGWRLILLVVLALVSSAACSLALALKRPRLAVALPVPLTIVAALVQPTETAVTTGAVAVGFVLMGLSTSFAADGVGDRFDSGFELRRVGRSLLGGLVVVGLLVAASQLSFLFPDQEITRVIPPQRPPISPPQPDVPLYRVDGPLETPLRVGVIDHYDVEEQAWMLPPVDQSRLVRTELPADLVDDAGDEPDALRVTVTVEQASGHLMPMPAASYRVEGDAVADYDPRTQSLSFVGRPVFTGLTYEVVSRPAPDGRQLSNVTFDELPADLEEFLVAPPIPSIVDELLADAPEGEYARLQVLRGALYETFVASGEGQPTDVSGARVVELLNGATGNPYELTAAEALLARWAGLPARIGFGYFRGAQDEGASIEFRPADAATYLEIWMGDLGWVPIIGTPPKAQQSLNNNQRNMDPNIQSAPELGISVFLPVRSGDGLPVFVYARYYLARVVPAVLGLGLLVLQYPVVLKRIRDRRRREWARARGPAGALAVAYCRLRDQMVDLSLPGGGLTPLELVELVDEDEEHAELAWLVTRGLWGDLRGRLTEEDAEIGRRLVASVRDRLTKAQPETARLLARLSRASLREPWSRDVPNVWYELRLRGRLPHPSLRRVIRPVQSLLRRVRPTAATSLLVLLAALFITGCSSGQPAAVEDTEAPFPTRLAPDAVAGMIVREEDKAQDAYAEGALDDNVIVDEGKVLSFSRNGLIQAALQVAQLKPGYVTSDDEVARAIADSLGEMDELRPQRDRELRVLRDGSQRVYLWFPTRNAMALLVLRTQIPEGAAESLSRALIDYGDGLEVNESALSAAFSTPPEPEPTS